VLLPLYISHSDIQGARIAGLLPPGYAWLVAQWATWASGGLFVPILHTHPVPEMEYIVQKSGAKLLIAAESFAQRGGKAEELVDKAGSV
jgi:malonyl-CoA/methylmalonyl-CoA synthetase